MHIYVIWVCHLYWNALLLVHMSKTLPWDVLISAHNRTCQAVPVWALWIIYIYVYCYSGFDIRALRNFGKSLKQTLWHSRLEESVHKRLRKSTRHPWGAFTAGAALSPPLLQFCGKHVKAFKWGHCDSNTVMHRSLSWLNIDLNLKLSTLQAEGFAKVDLQIPGRLVGMRQ